MESLHHRRESQSNIIIDGDFMKTRKDLNEEQKRLMNKFAKPKKLKEKYPFEFVFEEEVK